MKLGYFMQKSNIKDIFHDGTNLTLPGINGIWVKFSHFWPKNDGEKWSRKKYFCNPPCTKHFFAS